MARDSIIYVTQRVPYPPNRGDRIRTYHLLAGLSQHFDVHLGAFGDASDADEPELAALCASVFVGRLRRRRFVGAFGALASGKSLTPALLRSHAMRDWLRATVDSARPVAALASTGGLAPYLEDLDVPRRVIDFVDVDSEKWRLFAERRGGIPGAVYRLEANRLGNLEGRVANWADASVVVSEIEAESLRSREHVPSDRIHVIPNGVDTDHFDGAGAFENPYPHEAVPMVFTGVMEYWPNVDAVGWFARECMGQIRSVVPGAELWIVGARPTQAVRRLERLPGVVVTGSVHDVRPYLQHARIAIAPMRVGPGVQNKVLEAMSMSKVVLATPGAVAGLPFPVDQTVEEDSFKMAGGAIELLAASDLAVRGIRNRRCVVDHSSWRESTSDLVRCLAGHVP